jgi:hypothetical protein
MLTMWQWCKTRIDRLLISSPRGVVRGSGWECPGPEHSDPSVRLSGPLPLGKPAPGGAIVQSGASEGAVRCFGTRRHRPGGGKG